ncbi:uncharacterized protein BX664DRAFT_335803 [Halteromyces radiatus]|uniref:uncharacterized protein n=1 Tax=Halteromyces radiatus TaxID=101107 RepID=UPI00221F36E1|nr:uncharacterized protein BX664DRAFT_335803 [Halteromyces radiatus]KAI8086439.1 hypothetical protein BX664DRAFT_335803 [Halteromyces radiatus]
MVQFIRVTTEDFDHQVEKTLQDEKNKVFVLFFGTELDTTNESWCPDCVVADPLIRKSLLNVPNAVLIEAPVGLRDEWKGNTAHPYRVKFNVPAIPTLFKWSKAGPGAKLVEEEAADVDKLNAFVQN